MSTTKQMPFHRDGNLVLNSRGDEVCECVGELEAKDVTDALNLWGSQPVKKEEPKGVCEKCVQPHDGSRIGRLCGIPGCGGKVVQSVPFNCHVKKPDEQVKLEKEFAASLPPTPNQADTDAVAVKYYESGRTLEVQAWVVGDWTDQPEPNFSPRFPWRINPAKRRVVVEIYKTPSGGMSSMLKDFETAPSIFTLLGTIEGEVEL